jgi:hypothetical protein
MAGGALQGFLAFEAHPDSNFRVGNVYTRRSPFPSFQVLSRELLKKGSDSLLGSPYYAQFTPEMLRAVGMRERGPTVHARTRNLVDSMRTKGDTRGASGGKLHSNFCTARLLTHGLDDGCAARP